jgi:hypothetical protein
VSLFARYPKFIETSTTGASQDRLNLRHQAIIEWNRDLLDGARVLDIASHDGRWSFAALDVGAAHVIGVEARSHLVENARQTFKEYGAKDGSYEFRCGDLFEELRRDPPQVDVVLLLGIMYHVLDHVELVKLVATTGAKHVIVDTQVVRRNRVHPKLPNIISLQVDDVTSDGAQAVANVPGAPAWQGAIVAHPSRGAVEFVFDAFGFDTEEFDWPGLIAAQEQEPKHVWHYGHGSRATFRMTRREAN